MFSKERRSEIMRQIKGQDTNPERVVRSLLHRLGLRFRLHHKSLPGKPDLVLARWNTVVFIHGCFWHGHDCRRGSAHRKPKSNTGYWQKKLDRNLSRDAEHARELKKLGWKRVVIWECETKNPAALEKKLRRLFGLPTATVATTPSPRSSPV